MNTEAFDTLLNRLGTDLSVWPQGAAEEAKKLLLRSQSARGSYDALRGLETMIEASRPAVLPAQMRRVVQGALAEIARREANPTLLERFLRLLLAPTARAALAVGVTVAGFGLGMALRNPTPAAPAYANGGVLMMTASADDVLF